MDIVEIPTVVVVVFVSRVGCGYYGLDLLLSKLSKAQVGESSVSGTMRLEHLKKFIYFLVPKSSTHRGLNCVKNSAFNISLAESSVSGT